MGCFCGETVANPGCPVHGDFRVQLAPAPGRAAYLAKLLEPQPASRTEADPHGLNPHAPGAKLDAGKTLPWLCISGFARALRAVADVTTKGATKYTPNGWASVADGENRYMEAFARHALALGTGEQFDQDTGCMHKAQMAWNLLASLELELRAAEAWKTSGVRGAVST